MLNKFSWVQTICMIFSWRSISIVDVMKVLKDVTEHWINVSYLVYHSVIILHQSCTENKKFELLDKPGFIWFSFIFLYLIMLERIFYVILWLIFSIWQNNALLQLFGWVQNFLIFCNLGSTYSDLLGRFLYDGLNAWLWGTIQSMLKYNTICMCTFLWLSGCGV